MRSLILAVATFIALHFTAPLLTAQTSFPMITHTTPVAVERGKTTEVVVSGRMNFHGTYLVLMEAGGIKATVLTKPAKSKGNKIPQVRSIKLKLTVAPEAALGVREFRLASKLGVSSIGQIVVVDSPVVAEAKANNTADKAQKIDLPTVIAGRLEANEDLDYFQFDAKAGEHLTFEVFCARLQDKIHDLQKHAKPMLVLYDADGRELASNDHFYFADPLLSYTAKKSGTYYLQIRESTYAGDGRWVYALRATNRPYASHVYPMAAKPGQRIDVEPVGSARLTKDKVMLTAPMAVGIHRLQLDLGDAKSNPVTFLVSDLPMVLEKEGNDDIKSANAVSLPCGINGRLQKRRDLDHFAFRAKKAKAVRFEVKARRFGTQLVSSAHIVLDVMTAKGKILKANADTHSNTEASLVFAPPADGDYVLRVRDLNSKGGPTAVYFVECDWARPDFSLRCDPDKAMIGPGSSAAWFVKLERKNGFAGPVKVEVRNLPPGVTCSKLTLPPNITQGVLVLTADKKAKHAAANVSVVGAASLKQDDGTMKTVERIVQPMQEIYQPGGGRGLFPVTMQSVAVTDPSDILEVKVKPAKVNLKPGGEAKIEFEIVRNPGYTKNVSASIALKHLSRTYGDPLPPGVSVVSGKSKTLLGKGSKGHIVLRAAANAKPLDDVPVAVLAHVSINFVVKVSYCSPPIRLTVAKK